MSLLHLPPEVLLGIFDIGNFRIAHLKTLRLVHPVFSQFLLPRVFRSLTIGFHFFKHKEPRRIILGDEPEGIRQAVKKVTITTQRYELRSKYDANVRYRVVEAALNEFPNLELVIIDMDNNTTMTKSTSTLIRAIGKLLKERRLQIRLTYLRSLKTCLDAIPEEVELLDLSNRKGGDLESVLATILQTGTTFPKLTTFCVTGCYFEMDSFLSRLAPDNRNVFANLRELHLCQQLSSFWANLPRVGPLSEVSVGLLPKLRKISLADRRENGRYKIWNYLQYHDQRLENIHIRQAGPDLFQYLVSPSGSDITVLNLNLFAMKGMDIFADSANLATEFWTNVIPVIQRSLQSLTVAVVETERKRYYAVPQNGNFWTYLDHDDNPWSITSHDVQYEFPKLRKFTGYANYTPNIFNRLMAKVEPLPVLRDISFVLGVEDLSGTWPSTFDSTFADVEAIEHGDWGFSLNTDLDVDILIKAQVGRHESWHLLHKAKEYSFGALGWEARRD